LHTARGNLARSTGEPASLTVYRRDWLRGLELHQVSQAYETRRDSDPPRQNGADFQLRSGLRDLQDRVSTLRESAKVIALEGVAPSRTMALVPKTSVSSDSTIGPQNGMSPRCCPPLGRIWSSSCASWRATCKKERSPEIASGSSRWQRNSLLLTYDRKAKKNKHLQSVTPYRRAIFAGGISSASGGSHSFKTKKPHSRFASRAY
jgi:hypothetical protein